jgi:uncharacterized protein (TIGR00730 family)
MGQLADSVLAAGGCVTGVIPEHLATRELMHSALTTTQVVPNMHVRKATMAGLADAFIALPGGYGTLEELFEVVTWAQLGLHHKPIGLLDVKGFFEPLVMLIDGLVREGFVAQRHRSLVTVGESPSALLDSLRAQVAARVPAAPGGAELE